MILSQDEDNLRQGLIECLLLIPDQLVLQLIRIDIIVLQIRNGFTQLWFEIRIDLVVLGIQSELGQIFAVVLLLLELAQGIGRHIDCLQEEGTLQFLRHVVTHQSLRSTRRAESKEIDEPTGALTTPEAER